MSEEKLFWICSECGAENEYPHCRKCETCGTALSDEAFAEWKRILEKRAEKEAEEKREEERIRREKAAEERRVREAEARRRKEAEERARRVEEERRRREEEELRRRRVVEYRISKVRASVKREMRFGHVIQKIITVALVIYLIVCALGFLISTLDRIIDNGGFFFKIHSFLLNHNFYEVMMRVANDFVFVLIGFLSVYCIVISAIQRKADNCGFVGFGDAMEYSDDVISYQNNLVMCALVLFPIGALVSLLTLQLDFTAGRYEHFFAYSWEAGMTGSISLAKELLGDPSSSFVSTLLGISVSGAWLIIAIIAIIGTIVAACIKPSQKTQSYYGFIFPGIYTVSNLVFPYVSIVLVFLLNLLSKILGGIIGIFK